MGISNIENLIPGAIADRNIEIRRLFNEGWSHDTLAVRYGINSLEVKQIVEENT